MKLTKIPIIIYYGDFIPESQIQIPVRMDGGLVLKWQDYGGMLLTDMEVM